MGRKKGRRKAPFKLKLKPAQVMSIASVVLVVISGLIAISFSRMGTLLVLLNDGLLTNFGWASLVLIFLFFSGGLMISQVNWRIAKPNVFFGGILIFFSLLGLLQGGQLGSELFANLAALVYSAGAVIIFLGVLVVGIMITTEIALDEFLNILGKFLAPIFKIFAKKGSGSIQPRGEMKIKGADRQMELEDAVDALPVKPQTEMKVQNSRPALDKHVEEETSKELSQSVITSADPNKKAVWQTPSVNLLSKSTGGKADRGDLKKNAAIIENLLESFGIKARVVEVNCGPAVTQYALEISLGTKLSKITALQNDLALALAAPTGQIRIEAPIPGRSLVGIEIPNKSPEFVTLRTMLLSENAKKTNSKLAVALGLNVSGEPIITDIAKMPHVLIAGATGSGKSVCMNTIMSTILFRASPDEVKFILVDPKRVELTQYNDIPHLLTPVIVDPQKAGAALKWAVTEMNQRYKLFAEVGVRNISAYNELSGFQAVPYIVIMIDELADIMLVAPKETEQSIIKLAQMARAVGIHLVLATQRPSVDVLTGLIKANVPTRIAFNVASMVDSRVILDTAGAEKLLGKGDMLYISPEASKPMRVQGTFVSDKEINNLIDYLKNTGIAPQYTEEVTAKFSAPTVTSSTGQTIEDVDDLFPDAVRLVVEQQKASASMIQRYLSVGYARAARILDQLEQAGIVSGSDGSSKPRKVLATSAEEFLGPAK